MPTLLQSAVDDLRRIRALGGKRTPSLCHEIINSLAAYRDHQWLDGAASRAASNSALMLIWAITGDALDLLGQFHEAAAAYEKAASFQANTCFGDSYARIVLKHNLSNHYAPALRNLIDGISRNASTGWRIWLWAQFVSLAHPLHYVSYLRDVLHRRFRLRQLRWRIDSGTGHQSNIATNGAVTSDTTNCAPTTINNSPRSS